MRGKADHQSPSVSGDGEGKSGGRGPILGLGWAGAGTSAGRTIYTLTKVCSAILVV